jgi:hypothetical protein
MYSHIEMAIANLKVFESAVLQFAFAANPEIQQIFRQMPPH